MARLSKDCFNVLLEAENQGVVTAWPKVIPDDPIRECRRKEFLETWVLGGIQMAQRVFYPGPPWRDALTEKGRQRLHNDARYRKGRELLHD